MSVFEVLMNGVYAFSTTYNPIGSRFGYPPNTAGFPTGTSGCVNTGWKVNQTVLDEYLDRVPANCQPIRRI